LRRRRRGAGRALARVGGRPPPGAPRHRCARAGAPPAMNAGRRTPKRKRLWLVVASLGVLGVAVALVLTALNDNIVFFYSPTQVADRKPGPERHFRLGGLVEEGSLKKNGMEVRFTVTDLQKTVAVVYRGLL